MSYDVLILVLLILLFCFFSMVFTVNVLFSVFNSVRPEGTKEIKAVFPKRTTKKSKAQRELEKKAEEEQRKYETIMRNLEAYDGTDIGQEEVR